MSNPPLVQALPRQIDPRKFAQQGISIEGVVEVGRLPRLTELLASSEGNIEVRLDFFINEQRRPQVNGTINAKLELICQRCLGPLEANLDTETALAIIWDEDDSADIPRSLDPWVVGEGSVDIYSLVEDELLLTLPIVSYHKEDCVSPDLFSSGDSPEETAETQQDISPFKVLESLKGSLKKEP